MTFQELNPSEFMEFVNSRKEKNFFQTIYTYNRLKNNKIDCYLVGVKENNKIIAASLIAKTNHSFLGKFTYEAYKGFILDYENKELLKFMTEEVKKFLKSKNALRLIIDPYIPAVSRDMDANITSEFDNRYIKKYLEDIGYIYNENGNQVKWCYCLDINGKSAEELFNEFRSSTRNNINKTITKFKLNIKTLQKENLDEFKKVTSDTCKRRGFPDKTLKYYEDMYDAFGDLVTFKICELNLDTYINHLEEENSTFEQKINELSDSASNINKKDAMKKNIESNLKKIEEAKQLKIDKGNIIPLSAAMFMLYGDEIVYLFSGSYEEYMQFFGQYRLQWEIIKYAADNNYKRYNFYGIEDVFDPNGKDRGVYEFKKGFRGYVEELLGSFILPIDNINKLYDISTKIKNIIKK